MVGRAVFIQLALFACAAAAQDPPRVAQLRPADGTRTLDAAATTVLEVTFDQPMRKGRHSFCGGGETFPKVLGKPTWKDDRTIVLEVELAPDRSYSIGLNCPAAMGFCSAAGQPLAPVQWRFSTLPAVLPDPAEQQARNARSTEALFAALDSSYSYLDRRVGDWAQLRQRHSAALAAAPTDAAWAAAAATMLAAAEDLHLHLRLGEATFATATRSVDMLFRRGLLRRYLASEPAGDQAIAGRTEDGIGYVAIGAWSGDLDLAAIERALAGLRDCTAMVIDARLNAGGDEALAQRVAAWFVDGARVYAQHRFRERGGADGFGPVLERRVVGNADADRRFAGPIAVLTSRYTMSSNEAFVLMLRQAADCTQVGQPTQGSSGNPKPHRLPNGVVAVLPSWQALRPDGTCFEGEGIAPDIRVAATPADLATRDPILERALEVLRDKVSR